MAETVSYLYDNSGSLGMVIDSGSGITTTYYYDFIDRLAKYTEKGTNYSHSVEHVYDTKNNLSSLEETINGVLRTVGYSYDDDNRLQTVTGNGQTVVYTYDDFGRVEKQEVKNGTEVVLTTTYTYYDPTETTTSTQVKSIQQTADNYSVTYTYTYDGNGNILSISDGTNLYQYQYTDANKLYRENDPISGISKTYMYTDMGNVFVEIQRPYVNGSVGTTETYVNYGWDNEWGDMLTYYGDIPLYYDTVGNMTGDGTYTYTWEHGRELAEIVNGDGRWSFTYDANGMRTGKTRRNVFTDELMDTYTYVYNGSQLSQMKKNSDTLNFFYDGEGRPAYFTYGSATYYYVTNLQGDVVAILDSTGTMVVNYYYDAYGVLLQTGGTMATTLGILNPLTYRGYVYDHETGLYYLQSRYYNPVIKRFISADTTAVLTADLMSISNKSLFAYCDNNPVNRADDCGFFWHIVVGAAVGALINGVATVVSNAIDGRPIAEGLGTSMLSGAASGALASSGAGLGVMIAGNAAISMAEDATNQIVSNGGFSDFNVSNTIIAGINGGISGAIGGKGSGTKHLMNLGTQTVKRTINATMYNGINIGLSEAKKALVYYAKNTAKYYRGFLGSALKDLMSTTATSVVFTNTAKSYWQSSFVG